MRTGRKWRSELLSPVISGRVGGRLRFQVKPVPAGDCSRQSVRTLSAAFTLKDCGERIRPAHPAQLLDGVSGRRLTGVERPAAVPFPQW